MSEFWEDLAINLLEKNLNGHTLNEAGLKELFAERLDILDELDILNDGKEVDNLDKALYGGMPGIIEIREAKPTDIFHCKACNRSFKRGDNFRRHLNSKLHEKRQRALEIANQESVAKKVAEEV